MSRISWRLLLYIIILYQRRFAKSSTDEQKNPLDPLKVVTKEGDQTFTNDISKFKCEISSYQVYCEFNSNSECDLIKYNEEVLWKYEKDSTHGPLESFLYTKTLKLLLLGFKYYTRCYICNDSGSQFVKKLDYHSFPPCDLKIVTVDDSGARKENDPEAYDESAFFSYREYVFKQRTKCLEVRYGGRLVWTYGGPEHEHPNKVFIMSTSEIIGLSFHNCVLFFKKEDDGFKLLRKDQKVPFDKSDLAMYAGGPDGSEFIDESRYQYFTVPSTPVTGYVFNDDVKCTEVRYKGTTMWKKNPQEKDGYPKLIHVNWFRKVIVIQTPVSFCIYVFLNKEWVLLLKYPDEETYSISSGKPKSQDSDKKPDVVKIALTNKNLFIIILFAVLLILLVLSTVLWFLR